MNFSHRSTETSDGWRAWERENAAVVDGSLEIRPTQAPIYRNLTPVSPRQSHPEWVDIAVDRCGNVFLLDTAGQVYRIHCDDGGRLDRLDCPTQKRADPRAIGVTEHTIYVAHGAPGRVLAYSRETPGVRWVANDIVDPVALARTEDGMAVLDRGVEPGTGTVWSLTEGGDCSPLIVDLAEPVDLAIDPDGAVFILDRYEWPRTATPAGYVIRRVPSRVFSHPPLTGLETLVMPPGAFRVADPDRSDLLSVAPSSLVTDRAGSIVLGSDPAAGEAATICRFHPDRGECLPHSNVDEGARALALDRTGDTPTLYVVDHDGALLRLSGRIERHRDGDGDTSTGIGRIRLDAGTGGTTWHRVALEWERDDDGTGLAMRYAATDDPDPARYTVMTQETSDELTEIRHIGRRKAWRLRTAGIETIGEFAALDPSTLATILGVEEITVPPAEIEDWHEQAVTLVADGEQRLRAVEGIGRVFAARLAVAGIETLDDLLDRDVHTLTSVLGSRIRRFGHDRARECIADAEDRLPPRGDPEEVAWKSAPPDPEDVFLDDAQGRYLWVAIELSGTAETSPVICSVTTEYPRRSYLEDLPALYRTDQETADTLESLLAIFERTLTDVEHAYTDLLALLEPGGIPPEFLDWLGRSIGAELDATWPVEAQREILARARDLFRMRGTRNGLEAVIELYLEHVDIDTASWEHANPEFTPQLARIVEYGDLTCVRQTAAWEPYSRALTTPAGFLVLLHPALAAEHVDAIGRIVRSQQPAHTRGTAVALRPRTMLTGHDDGERTMHAYLGVNTCLSDQAFTADQSLLGEETTLREREPHASLGIRSRLDEEARLS